MTFFLSHQISLSKNYCRPVKILFKGGNTSFLLQVFCITIDQNLITIYVKNWLEPYPTTFISSYNIVYGVAQIFVATMRKNPRLGMEEMQLRSHLESNLLAKPRVIKITQLQQVCLGFFQFEIRLNMVCKSSFSGYI
jgi:hypothetical protein